jgi:hypothetical protein
VCVTVATNAVSSFTMLIRVGEMIDDRDLVVRASGDRDRLETDADRPDRRQRPVVDAKDFQALVGRARVQMRSP